MSAPDDSSERIILETKDIQIKNYYYHLVLTNRRIIFTGGSDNKHRSIALGAVQGIESGTDHAGNPTIMVSAPSATGEIKQVILRFSPRDFPDAQQVRSLWYSEIRKRIPHPVWGSRYHTPKTVSPAPAFCTTCGKKLADGSVFCDSCGAKIRDPFPPLSPGQGYSDDQEIFRQPEVSAGTIDLPRKDQTYSAMEFPATRQNPPVLRPLRKEEWKKKPLFSGSLIKKPFFLFGIILAVAILAVAVFFMTAPSGSPGFNFTFPALNVSLPDLSGVAVPGNHSVTTTTSSEIPGSSTNPGEPSAANETPPLSTVTMAPGDPGAVMATYPALYNSGNGAGIHLLLSENQKSYYSIDTLNSELASARSEGYSIQNIVILDQTIEESSAVLDTEIAWTVGGSPTTSTPKLFFVYENGQWKLDSVLFHPEQQ